MTDLAEWVRNEQDILWNDLGKVTFAATVAAINSDRERNWINGGG